jgi:hypothetical protein
MNRTVSSRLARLEKVIAPPRRKFLLADFMLDLDIEAECVRLCREEGMTDGDELIVVQWLPPQ